MKTQYLKPILVLISLSLILTSASAMRTDPYDSKSYVTNAIDKVSLWYHQNFGVDYYNARQMMIEVGNQESWLGTYPTTYIEGRNDLGWAQFSKSSKAAFADIQKRWLIEDDNGGRVEAIKQRWGFDPLEISAEDLAYSEQGADIMSAVFMREFILQRGDNVPSTLDGRAAWWKRYYNTVAGSGTEEKYIENNVDKTGQWVYAGTTSEGDKYYFLSDEFFYLNGQSAKIVYVPEGTTTIPDASTVIQVSQPETATISEPGLEVSEYEEVDGAHTSKKYVTTSIENVARWYNEEFEKEYARALQLMIEVGNYETGMGTREGIGNGWANFFAGKFAAFEDAKQGIASHPNRRDAIIQKWEIDIQDVDVEDLENNTESMGIASAIFLREFMLRDPDPLPKTLEERAKWWKGKYRRSNEVSEAAYISANTIKDRNGKVWVYAGTVERGGEDLDKYYLKESEALYLSRSPSSSVAYLSQDGDFKTYSCIRKGLDSGNWNSFKNGCLWIKYCDTYYSRTAASSFDTYLRDEWVKGSFSKIMTDDSMSEPTRYSNYKTGDMNREGCSRFAVINFAYAGCGTGIGIEALESGETPNIQSPLPYEGSSCVVMDESTEENLVTSLFSTEGVPEQERKPKWYYPNELWSNVFSSDTHSYLAMFSVYMTREYPDFQASGVAYQFMPAGIRFNQSIELMMTNGGKDFTHGDGIFLYRFEDDEIFNDCNVSLMASISRMIGPEGGVIEIDDVKQIFPEGALSKETEITVKKLRLRCLEVNEGFEDSVISEEDTVTLAPEPEGSADYIWLLIAGIIIITIIVYLKRDTLLKL